MIFACSCTQSEDIPEASSVESSESISDESLAEESVSNESLADDNSSIESVEPKPDTRDDKISECVVITTEKTEYSVDETMKVFLSTNHKDPDDLIYYGDRFWFEYYKDGEWHKCEKDFMWTEEALCFGAISQYEATHYIKISERIDEGYEKYRVVSEFRSDKHKPGLIYSNEFVLVP